MPFQGSRIYLFILIAVVAVIAVVALVANAPATRSTPTPGIVVCEVRAQIGVDLIKVANLNTGTSIILTSLDLPFRFNASSGDTLRYTVVTQEGYVFNTWFFNTGTFDNHNPLTRVIDAPIIMTATVLILPEQPSPSPTIKVTE